MSHFDKPYPMFRRFTVGKFDEYEDELKARHKVAFEPSVAYMLKSAARLRERAKAACNPVIAQRQLLMAALQERGVDFRPILRETEKACPRCKSGRVLDGNCDLCGFGHDAIARA